MRRRPVEAWLVDEMLNAGSVSLDFEGCEPPLDLRNDKHLRLCDKRTALELALWWMWEAYQRDVWTQEEIEWTRAASEKSMAKFREDLGLPTEAV